MEVFRQYAGYYDLIYRDKDYALECDFIEEIFSKFSARPVRTLLDLGCGTGGHALIMSGRGFKVTGVDLSEEMLKEARLKAGKSGLDVEFIGSDIREFNLGACFDATVAMFAVIGYQTENADLIGTLRSVRNHLRPGGVFTFDVWFGPAVLNLKPEDKEITIEDGGETVTRRTRAELNCMEHTVDVHFTITRTQGGRTIDELSEVHKMRYFFPKEIEYLLESNGFELLGIYPFLDMGGQCTINTWNVSIVARAA